jgi:general secretion pathway protein A
MYEEYYGLISKPFQLNPDPGFYFGSKQHRRAKAYLEYGVQRSEGFIVITGEIGAGKTTIVRGLLDSLDPATVMAANLVSTQLDAEDTLRMVGAAFGIRVKDTSKADLLMALEAFLITQTSQNKRCLLIVDEAQNLSPKAVEELRMLSNFQYGKQALLQTFLVGQPEFRDILQNPNMQQLRQRVTATCHIGPMDQDETRGYIEHRLKCAGATNRPTFEPTAFEVIFAASGGIPRRINSLCDRLMLYGFLAEKDHFTQDDVKEVVAEINAESSRPNTYEQVTADAVYASDPYRQTPGSAGVAAHASSATVDINMQDMEFDSSFADGLSEQIARLATEQYSDRLHRIERSMLRQERVNLEILAMLQKMVTSNRKPRLDTASDGT